MKKLMFWKKSPPTFTQRCATAAREGAVAGVGGATCYAVIHLAVSALERLIPANPRVAEATGEAEAKPFARAA